MSSEAFDELYERHAIEAMVIRLDRQEIEEANLRAKRADVAERLGMQSKIAAWLREALQPRGATHMMLGSDGARAAESLMTTGGARTNIIVVEDNLTTLHDLINDCTTMPEPGTNYTIQLHLFGMMTLERGQISRTFQYRAPLIEQMRKHRSGKKGTTPKLFVIGDVPGGEAMTAMVDDARVDCASYNGTALGTQRLLLDREAGEALAPQFNRARESSSPALQEAQRAMQAWFLRRAADTAHAHLKDDAPFIVHGSTSVPEHIDNGAALEHLTKTALHGVSHLWTLRRQIAIRLLDGITLMRDPRGHNLLYAMELLRREPEDADLEEIKNEACEGK